MKILSQKFLFKRNNHSTLKFLILKNFRLYRIQCIAFEDFMLCTSGMCCIHSNKQICMCHVKQHFPRLKSNKWKSNWLKNMAITRSSPKIDYLISKARTTKKLFSLQQKRGDCYTNYCSLFHMTL